LAAAAAGRRRPSRAQSMARIILARAAQSLGVLVVVSLLVFVGVYAIGNPVLVLTDPRSPPEVIAQTMRDLGLDRPLWEQYLLFLRNVLTGDFGVSYVHSRPALALILERLPATLELVLAALAIATLIGLPLGLVAGRAGERPLGRGVALASILGFSLPSFWVGLMLVMVFAIELNMLPASGRGDLGELLGIRTSLATPDGLRHLILPALNLALFPAALLLRLVRSGVQEQLGLDYVRFARAKGLTERRILIAYVLRNTLIPVITVMGIVTGGLIAFAVVTESVFAWPGMGKLIIDSIRQLDRPVIVSYILVIVVLFTLINFLVDILYTLIDPRVRLGARRP
jgi:peptide/nickel transport system permease protein